MAEKSKETKTVDSSRRGFLSKSAVGAGAALECPADATTKVTPIRG